MALRYSSGLRNFLNEGGSVKQALANGILKVYTGTQPATGDTAASGTLLTSYTVGSAAHTNEVLATGAFTITGTSGSVDTVTVNSIDILGGAVTNTGTAAGTATAVVAAINNNPKNFMFVASSDGSTGVVTLTAKPGLGTLCNGWAVSGTATTSSLGTLVNIGSGVAGVNPANGLKFGDSAAGTLVKDSTQTWSGVAAATGTAGWFRFYGAVADDGTADSAEAKLRLDGNIATSGANMNLSSTSIVASATQTINTFSLTLPASA
jgi:hypothetical protein